MPAGHEDIDAGKAVERALRRQASSAQNRRDLTRLPLFRVDRELPDELDGLLRQLQQAER